MTPRNPTLTALVGLGILNHSVLTGTRVTATLAALREGASTATVGMILALYALLPMLLSVSAGRLSDRIGVRRPMLVGSVALSLAAALPLVLDGSIGLFLSAALVGVSFMLYQVPAQNATGELGDPAERTHNFSLLSLGYAVSGFMGPLVAGFTIDHGGFSHAFAIFALVPLFTAAALARGMRGLPRPQPVHAQVRAGGPIELLMHHKLKRVFMVNFLLAMGWDLHTIIVPVYGEKLGLSASQIGVILASFGVATFVVRFSMRWIVRRWSEHEMLSVSLLAAGLVYLVYPFSTTAPMLMALSFSLGLGLGVSQPLVLSLLHTHAPRGRMGEAAGVRMSLVQTSSVSVPLIFGALGASIGLMPVFWSVGLCLAAGGAFNRREK